MKPSTERMIRADIALRWSPLLIVLLVFFGTIAGLGLIGVAAYLTGALR